MSYQRKLSSLASKVGQEGVAKLASVLDTEAAKATAPWQRTLLDLLAETARKEGPEGFAIAQQAVERWLSGQETDIRKVTNNLLIASNLVAQLEQAEAERKERARKWLRAVGEALGRIVKALVGTAL